MLNIGKSINMMSDVGKSFFACHLLFSQVLLLDLFHSRCYDKIQTLEKLHNLKLNFPVLGKLLDEKKSRVTGTHFEA
jgi:hypothetical protein